MLQKKIKSKSAGRVQSVALRLICEREKEIEAFIPEEYWRVKAMFEKDDISFEAELAKYQNKKIELKNAEETQHVYESLNKEFIVSDVKKTQKKRASKPPFITSTLQQEASSKLNFKAKRTMMIAQKLYEGIDIGEETVGLITYMRTDSIRLSDTFIDEAKHYIQEKYGYEVINYGTDSTDRFNYPVAGEAVANAVIAGVVDKGIVICGTGVGISLAANKVNGIRCVTCSEPYSAKLSREHNNTNMLAFGARVVGIELAKMIVDAWLTGEYEGGRHQVRIDMLKDIEERQK